MKTSDKDQRIKVLRVSAHALVTLFLSKAAIWKFEGLPKDAKVLGVNIDHAWSNTFYIVIESQEFPVAEPGKVLEEIVVTLHRTEVEL